MSHRFKRPKPTTAEGRKQAEVRRLARSIRDQATLDRILDDCQHDCQPGMRAAVFAHLRPHLGFPNAVDRGVQDEVAV